MFAALAHRNPGTATGFRLRRWTQNGLLLPATEAAAEAIGHALHRGPHPGYDEVVDARLAAIAAAFHQPVAGRSALPGLALTTAEGRLTTLQAALRRALTDRHRLGLWLNRRDPLRLFADRSFLDHAITALYGED